MAIVSKDTKKGGDGMSESILGDIEEILLLSKGLKSRSGATLDAIEKSEKEDWMEKIGICALCASETVNGTCTGCTNLQGRK
jgi:hypothetical protein